MRQCLCGGGKRCFPGVGSSAQRGQEHSGERQIADAGGHSPSSKTRWQEMLRKIRYSVLSGSTGEGGSGGSVGVAMTTAGVPFSTQTLAVTSTPRSLSLASISSEGSTDSHLVEREDIVALTTAVRAFKDALGKLKRIFHPERDKSETLRVAGHERLGEVLRILRTILEKYSPIQHNELLAAASHLISHVNGYGYEDDHADPTAFLEAIDQLALAFSSRVSEYLMGDIDSSSAVLNCSTASSRNKSYENLMSSDAESSAGEPRSSGAVEAAETSSGVLDTSLKEPEVLTPQQIDEQLHRHEQGVEHALYRAKVWSKYAKDVIAYIEKRAQLDLDHCRALTKLAHVTRPALKDESFLPFQSIYCTALDQDIENCAQLSQTSTLLLTQKFVEPLTARRNEHDRARKVIKESWTKELKRVTEALSNLKKAKMGYDQRHQELGRAREAAARGENTEAQDKLERKRDEALQKAKEAEAWYKTCVHEANERHASLLRLKRDVLVQLRDLIFQCDQTMKAVTVGYFQLQHTVAAPAPVQFQTLCESSRLYEPGSQYMEFVKRLGPSPGPEQPESPFTFQSYRPGASNLSPHHDPAANGAVPPHDDLQVGRLPGPGGSDTDSVGSSAKSMEGSPTASPLPPPRRPHTVSSGDELETDPDTDPHYTYPSLRQVMSKAAISHSFKKLLTPSRCRECDSYVYFHGYECGECGLGCHKKCLETLAIKCGHKRLPRKMTTFGVDLAQHLTETNTTVPHLVVKCVAEIDARGGKIKGIYRVSGVKSRVEKLCQAFENGAHLVDLSDQHPNVIANVLKLYLRQLPEPLLTFRLYPDFIRIAKECGTGTGAEGTSRAGEELRELVGRLPRHHLACLAVLMHHLHRVATHSQLNNMPPSNLGIVFGPTLLRTSEGSASLSSLVDTVHQTRAIELLIMCVNEIFGHQDPLQAASGVTSKRAGEDQFRPSQSKHGSVPVSSSSSSSMVYTVPIAGYRRSTTDSEDAHSTSHACKERKDSDVQDDDWDSESWEESAFEGVGSGVGGDASSAALPTTTTTTTMSSSSSSIAAAAAAATCPVPPPRASPAASRTSAGQAKIYKTSLKDYVGLEGVALHVSSGLHTAHDVVHQKLRKTVSDISSSLRSSSPAAAAITTITTTTTAAIASPAATTTTTTTVLIPSPSTHDMQRRGTLEDVKKVVVGVGVTGGGGGGQQDERKSMESSPRKPLQQEEVTRRRPPHLEETGRRPTIEETPRKSEEGARRTEQEASRSHQQTPRPQVYKSESKGSVGETELKVEARMGVAGGAEQVVVPPPRKVSPLLGQRAALAQHSGTDSSLDSDHSYDLHIQTHTPAPPSVPTHRRAEIGYSATTRSFSTSRDASLDNLTSSVTSSDSSSQELDSAHATEDSHSSEAPDDPHALSHALTYSSGCGGSSGGESGYVSPYLGAGPSPGSLVVGPSVLVTRATIAQYDKRRTITTVLAPRTSFDENRVRIQVPPAPAGGGRTPGTSSLVTVGVEEGGTMSLSNPPASPRVTVQDPPSPTARLLQPQPQSPGTPAVSSLTTVRTPGPRSPAVQPEHPRRPSPNRSPRFV
ncbi:rho GTPase-activating protein 45-like isoform X4 [Portunus trituberculatus]|uniref:rho GTPase-activating protein 45-like isoform X4 n=1 Tax=Portunus trituberculatus TaxID=210409 RepID=UPI001E1CE611|nr:rho GTPase-activating protein 45-like isoform X4 [Portunus trituberculatus]